MLQSLIHNDSIEIYQLRIWIKGISPMIWRRILVSSSSSLADLHYAIQIAMGWSDIHLHQFDIWGKGYDLCYLGRVHRDVVRKASCNDLENQSLASLLP